MIEPFVSEVLKELRQQIDTRRDVVTAGNMKLFDEYRYMCGEIAGLDKAATIIRETLDLVLKGTPSP